MEINNGTVHLDVSTLQWLVYTILPFLVDLVTRRFADGRVKAGVLGVFAVLTATLQEAIQYDGDVHLPSLLGKFVTALATAFLVHRFVWSPAHLTGDRGVILKVLPTGVGKIDPAKAAQYGAAPGRR